MTDQLTNTKRIESLDFLKGMIMIIMALDHVRDFFHADAFLYDPTDVTQTNPILFFTRFITHYCAPVFVFLAGSSAFFVGRRMSKAQLSVWLLKRGFWLMLVEVIIIKIAFTFKFSFEVTVWQVIWLLGASMITLAAFIHLPKKLMIAICLIGIFGHNLLDGYSPDSFSTIWSILHVRGLINIAGFNIVSAYPMIPWIFVMALGYYFGGLYQREFPQMRRLKYLKYVGITSIVLFVIIRFINIYGDPKPWTTQDSPIYTFLSFLEVSKYPPSLDYLLITLGPAILLLAFVENLKGRIHAIVTMFGRVPLFFYIIHFYLIHSLALIAAVATGFPASSMIVDVFITMSPNLEGYGFSLWLVYVVWLFVIILLYPVCNWYDIYKRNRREHWWLTYI
ncbi:MAG: putative membrane protein [Marinoscillum sp.]|jgi:uncharacterized membrane protein